MSLLHTYQLLVYQVKHKAWQRDGSELLENWNNIVTKGINYDCGGCG